MRLLGGLTPIAKYRDNLILRSLPGATSFRLGSISCLIEGLDGRIQN